jgi:hypothetical protein
VFVLVDATITLQPKRIDVSSRRLVSGALWNTDQSKKAFEIYPPLWTDAVLARESLIISGVLISPCMHVLSMFKVVFTFQDRRSDAGLALLSWLVEPS